MPLVISPEIRRHIAIAKDIMQSPYFFINQYPFIFYTNLDDYTKTEMICQYLLQKYIKKHKFRVNSIDKIGVIVYNKSMNTCSYIHIFKREEKRMTKAPVIKEASRLSELYKAFADETRVKILISLLSGEKCVGDIVNETGMSQSAVSHQLKILKLSSLVSGEKAGRLVTYALADDHVKMIINMGLDHVHHTAKE